MLCLVGVVLVLVLVQMMSGSGSGSGEFNFKSLFLQQLMILDPVVPEVQVQKQLPPNHHHNNKTSNSLTQSTMAARADIDEETDEVVGSMEVGGLLTLNKDIPPPHKNNNNVHNAFTTCLLELEQEWVPLIYELNQQCLPMIQFVKIIEDAFVVLVNTIDLPGADSKRSFAEAEYACNGLFHGTTVSAYPKKAGTASAVMVACSPSIHASQTVLSSVSVRAVVTEAARKMCPSYPQESSPQHLSAGGKYSNDTTRVVEYTYNITKIDQCEREDIRQHEGRGLRPTIGIHAVFIGDRHKALEWAAYHHLIGFDHVWLYVNDDWNHGKDLVHRDYITWIPYHYQLSAYHYQRPRGHDPKEVFRAAGQVDGLWRAKRMGLDWISFMDVDEYIRLDSPVLSSSSSGTSNDTFAASLQAFGPGVSVSDIETLPKYLTVFKEKMGEKYLALRTNSIFFGRGPEEKPTTPTTDNNIKNSTTTDNNNCQQLSKPLDIDYVWRQHGDVGKHELTRYKMIVDVSCALMVYIHYLKGSACPGKGIWNPNAKDLRHNHYKQAQRGVYGTAPDKVERDTSMVDRYREQLINEVCATTTS